MKFKKTTYHEQLVDMIRNLIMVGKLKEGDKINESALSSEIGISKTPLREALKVLSVEGLIELVPNRGAFVTTPRFEEVCEMFDVMVFLEGFCATKAVANMSSKDFSRLEKLHAKLEEKFERRNQEEYIHVNNQFHAFLQELAGNRTLNKIISDLRKKILLYRFKSLSLPGRFECSIKEHRELLLAFREKNHQKVEVLIKEHLKNQWKALKELNKKSKTQEGHSDTK